MDLPPEPAAVERFRAWMRERGAWMHPSLRFVTGDYGMSVVATELIPADTTILSCPFELAITPASSRTALRAAFGDMVDSRLEQLHDRQAIISYILMHSDIHSSNELIHKPYLDTLPPASRLTTPMYFNDYEMSLLRGTNMYSATETRREDWEREWDHCRKVFWRIPGFNIGFAWENYMKAATWLSSRAFPSSVLSVSAPSSTSDTSAPILLPVIDCLNHKRAHPVSWITAQQGPNSDAKPGVPCITLVHHLPLSPGADVFNNYGPKPNSELLLGYGFTLPRNPEDTILLQLNGGRMHEIGRDARGVEPLWAEVLAALEGHGEKQWEVELEAATGFGELVLTKLDEHPLITPDVITSEHVRPEVWTMIRNYVEGQRDILDALYEFCWSMQRKAAALAKLEGVDVILERLDEDEEEEELVESVLSKPPDDDDHGLR